MIVHFSALLYYFNVQVGRKADLCHHSNWSSSSHQSTDDFLSASIFFSTLLTRSLVAVVDSNIDTHFMCNIWHESAHAVKYRLWIRDQGLKEKGSMTELLEFTNELRHEIMNMYSTVCHLQWMILVIASWLFSLPYYSVNKNEYVNNSAKQGIISNNTCQQVSCKQVRHRSSSISDPIAIHCDPLCQWQWRC